MKMKMKMKIQPQVTKFYSYQRQSSWYLQIDIDTARLDSNDKIRYDMVLCIPLSVGRRLLLWLLAIGSDGGLKPFPTHHEFFPHSCIHVFLFIRKTFIRKRASKSLKS